MARTESAQAAAMIRKELKANGIKASVTSSNYSMGSSVNVSLENPLPAVATQVKEFTRKFGYEHSKSNGVPQARFIFVESDWSIEHFEAAVEIAKDLMNENASYYEEKYHNLPCLARNILNGEVGNYWTSRKPRVRAA